MSALIAELKKPSVWVAGIVITIVTIWFVLPIVDKWKQPRA